MDHIPSTKAEADDHIRKLRELRGISGDDNDISNGILLSSLDEALKLLSDQLYTTPTHFLLELIQNADDNTYLHKAIPRLHLSLYKKEGKMFFRSDCNEIGFTFQQLDALARIGKSTKTTITSGRKGYIGEKGIGFKSVFKVADVVHIASGCYEFKLDRRQTIGMMLPIISRFPPDDRVDGHTQVLLEIKCDSDYSQIKRELEWIESQILLFIRKIKQLDISIDGRNRVYRCLTKSLDKDFGGETKIISETINDIVTKRTKYIIHRHTIKGLPPDPRREGVDASEIVLAFAFKGKGTPITKPQQVFAFLPIHSYGFPFLIHADFLLIASRESLEYSCPWNLALQKGIQDAMVTMIFDRFVHLDEVDDDAGLCYSWPKYLTLQSGGFSFWNVLYNNILSALRCKAILWSRDRDVGLQKPTALRYVPESYRFNGRTFFDLPSIIATHLSFAYDDVYEHLSFIGVSRLSLDDLCDEFCQWVIATGVDGLKEQSEEWHSKVAILFYEESRNIRAKLQELPIIPLRDGSWVKATKPHLYLPSLNKNELISSGVDISFVDQDAARDPFRRRLYRYLGIQECSPRQVCMLIHEVHRELAIKRTGRSTQELIEDGVYLFKHRSEHNYLGTLDIFFVTNRNGQVFLSRRPRVYLVDPNSTYGVITKYKDTPGSPFTVLSDAYEAAIREDGDTKSLSEFRNWLLQSSSRFASTPDLIRNSSLTPEWRFLRDQNVLDLLHVVRETLSITPIAPAKLLEAVPRLQVRCLDSVSRVLDGLALPTPALKRACPHLDFADLPEPTYSNWGFLSDFGVIIELGTSAILRELGALGRVPVHEVDVTAVRNFYDILDSYTDRDEREILLAFRNQPLVFIPKPSPGTWLRHDDSVWTAPTLLARVTELKSYYPRCRRLFRTLLGVQDAGTRHVVDEFCEPISGEKSEIQKRFTGLLSLLEEFHTKSGLTGNQISRIRSAKVFPVLAKQFPSGENPVQVEMKALTDCWYIPDSVALESAFRGKIDMLSLSEQSAKVPKKLKNLFKVLGCEEEFLSVSVKTVVKPNGIAVRRIPDEEKFRERLRCIARLIEDSNGTPPDIPSLRIFSVPSITITMLIEAVEVIFDDKLVTINDSGEDTGIDIYLRAGIDEAHWPLVTFELVEYFKKHMAFDEKHANLIKLLMDAPIYTLHKILEQNDILLPPGFGDHQDAKSNSEGADTLDDGQTPVDQEEDAPSNGDYSHRSGDHVDSPGDNHWLRATVSAPIVDSNTESDTGQDSHSLSTPYVARNYHYSTPLRNPPPLRVEGVIRRPSVFRLDADATTAPIHHQHSESQAATPRVSLPIRTKISENDSNHLELVAESRADERPVAVVAGTTYHRSVGVEDGGYYNGSTSNRRRPFDNINRVIHRPVDNTSDIRAREIGFLGEHFIFKKFAQRISDWTFSHWTSQLRSQAGHPPFEGIEKYFSDFTYVDANGRMRAVLRDAGVESNGTWSDTTTFRLEVKSTLGPCVEPMFVSQNQLDMMRLYDNTPNDAYILLRVFNLGDGRDPDVRFFRDPWSLYMGGVLDFTSDNGYRVFH